jgi:hypothetical protein
MQLALTGLNPAIALIKVAVESALISLNPATPDSSFSQKAPQEATSEWANRSSGIALDSSTHLGFLKSKRQADLLLNLQILKPSYSEETAVIDLSYYARIETTWWTVELARLC